MEGAGHFLQEDRGPRAGRRRGAVRGGHAPGLTTRPASTPRGGSAAGPLRRAAAASASGSGGPPVPSCAFRAASSLSTCASLPTWSSSFWMSSVPPPTSSRTPDSSSSSRAPERACMVAILSCARCSEAPESLNDFEMPAVLSSTSEIGLGRGVLRLEGLLLGAEVVHPLLQGVEGRGELLLLLVELLALRLHLVDLLLGGRLARQRLLGQVLPVGRQGLLGLVLQVVDGVLELLLLELQALLRRGEVDQRAAHLGDLLEHLLVREVEHLVGLLGRVERLVRLGLHDVVCPLEDAHVSLPEGSVRDPTIDSNQAVCAPAVAAALRLRLRGVQQLPDHRALGQGVRPTVVRVLLRQSALHRLVALAVPRRRRPTANGNGDSRPRPGCPLPRHGRARCATPPCRAPAGARRRRPGPPRSRRRPSRPAGPPPRRSARCPPPTPPRRGWAWRPCRARPCSRRGARRPPGRRGGHGPSRTPAHRGPPSQGRTGTSRTSDVASPRSACAAVAPPRIRSSARSAPLRTECSQRTPCCRPGQDPEAATIGPLRWVPDMSPSLGASPKDDTLPSAVTTQ